MRRSKTLARLRRGELVKTCVLGHYMPAYICHAARAGYDCIWLDMEHRAFTIHQVQALLAYAHLFDIDMLIRPPTTEKTGLYRYLEEGATGLLIPHVSSVEKAQELVQSVKFPPVGDRGIDNAGLDSDFHAHDPDEYIAWANQETFLAVQIETPIAVHQSAEIASVNGVDLLFVGPGDLGLRLRQSNEMSLDDAYERVAESCRSANLAWGCPAISDEELQKRRAQGAQLLVNCSEFDSFSSSLAEKINRFE